MHKIVNPKQTRFFDSFDNVLTEKTRKRLPDGWASVFRRVILELMPVAIKRFLTQLTRHDSKGSEVLDSLEESELLPQEMFAEAHYCSDENIQAAANRGVELVGPVQCGSLVDKDVDHLNVDDFNVDEQSGEVVCCPSGHKPAWSIHDKQTGLGRLRVRGRPRVFHSILLIAGWNILRAVACAKMREILYARADMAVFWLRFTFLLVPIVCRSPRRRPKRHFFAAPLVRSETTKQSLSFEWFEIAASAFGLLAMTTPKISPDRTLAICGIPTILCYELSDF